MSQITNKDAVKAIFNGARMPIQETPSELGKTCVPVMDMTPNFHRVCNIVRSTLLIAPTTLYTTPTDRDFYICSAYVQSSAFTDVDASRIITVQIDGQSQILLQTKEQDGITATGNVHTSSLSINPIFPIRIDRGTNIVITGDGAKGTAGIIGYTVDLN
jgi:hypothetical protein